MSLQHSHHTRGLKSLRPLAARGVRVAEEQEVGNVDVELGYQWRNEVSPLPHCVGANTVKETERWFGWFVSFGDPTVHDRAVAEIDGRGFETCVSESVPVAPVSGFSEAETLGHCCDQSGMN